MPHVRLTLDEAEQLCFDVLKNLGYGDGDARLISKHLIDAEARGFPAKGLAHCLSVADHILGHLGIDGVVPSTRIIVTRAGPTYAQVNGNNAVGFLVARRAMEMAIEKVKAMGIAVVSAHNTWHHGSLVNYAEAATRDGFIVMMTSTGTPVVAPHQGRDARFATNPFLLGVPTSRRDRPVIWEYGTTEVMYAQIKLAQRLGSDLPEGAARTYDGQPTTDPHKAVPPAGFMTAWGGQRGSELAMMTHLLGMLAGSTAQTGDMSDFGLLIVVIDPRVLRDYDDFLKEIDTFCELMRTTKMLPGAETPKMPFDEGFERRRQAVQRGWVEVDEDVVEELKGLTHSSLRWLI